MKSNEYKCKLITTKENAPSVRIGNDIITCSKDERTKKEHYRPISILPIISKYSREEYVGTNI